MSAEEFRRARDLLLELREDFDDAARRFRWPATERFNWALDWFDGVLATDPASADRTALRILQPASGADLRLSFRDLSQRSNRTANFLRAAGLKRGDRMLLLLGNVPALWDTMLAAIKLGVVVIPATTLLTAEELADRLERGEVSAVLGEASQAAKIDATGFAGTRIGVGAVPEGWMDLARRDEHSPAFEREGETRGDDPLLLYFTSGTTAKPKLVLHTHRSYPVGSLSTMYWLGLQPGDRHLNVSSPGWAKHAWSSFFAPWNAGATVIVVEQPRFDAALLLRSMREADVSTFCAPPTVWRHLVREDLGERPASLRELCAAGEPLNPEVIERIDASWALRIRDGYGQTESTAMIANTPGRAGTPGAMGSPLPGYRIALLDPDGAEAAEGELCVRLGAERPAGLMTGYVQNDGRMAGADGEVYRTGDVAQRNADGTITFVGRADDVFKSSDYRISPFELESVLVEHPAVREAAVVPLADPLRLAVPQAFVALGAGIRPDDETARSVFAHLAQRLAPFKRIRRITFVEDLPKTVSGKIRRVELRRGDDRENGDRILGQFVEENARDVSRG